MSFKRHGAPEEMKVMKFRCLSCGKEATVLKNGRCQLCDLNNDPYIITEENPKKNKRKKN